MAKRKKWQKDKQRSTKQKTKDRAIRTPLKIGSELGCPRVVSCSYSTCGTRRVNLWSRIRKGPDCDYDKRNISVVICDTYYSVTVSKVMVAIVKLQLNQSIMSFTTSCYIELYSDGWIDQWNEDENVTWRSTITHVIRC